MKLLDNISHFLSLLRGIFCYLFFRKYSPKELYHSDTYWAWHYRAKALKGIRPLERRFILYYLKKSKYF